MKIVLIGNYERDRQESMLRFANLVADQLRKRSIPVELIRPPVRMGRMNTGNGFLDKWIGYVDKLVLFPRSRQFLKHCLAKSDCVFHVCDHSNALYVPKLKTSRVIVTCHDLLAIRSARGEIAENPTRRSGQKLQRLILNGLRKAGHVVCISRQTRTELIGLTGFEENRISVVPNSLNHGYSPMDPAEAQQRVAVITGMPGHSTIFGDASVHLARKFPRGYLVHVGGNQWYKNRMGLLRIYLRLLELDPQAPKLLIVGKALSDEHRAWVAEHSLEERVSVLEGVDNEGLRAIYTLARMLVFPSLAEGFGWPILEAQACGCPVITSSRAPMPEVGGDGARYCNPQNHREAARLICDLLRDEGSTRLWLKEAGFRNLLRFSSDQMVEGYVKAYERLMSARVS